MKVQALLVFLLAGSMSLMAQKSYQVTIAGQKTANGSYRR